MSENGKFFKRLVALVHALLPEDWFGRAGKYFRKTTQIISEFADEHKVRPQDMAHEGVELARTALHGKANKDFAAAVKDFADGERIKVETELTRRSATSEVRKKEADARLAELQVLHSEADLIEKLQRLKVALHENSEGKLSVLAAPKHFNLAEVTRRRLQTSGIPAEEVLEFLVNQLNSQFAEYHITITVTEECKEWISTRTQDASSMGTRTLWQSFQRYIKNPLYENLNLITLRPAFIEIYLESDMLLFRQVGDGAEKTEGVVLSGG